MAKKPNTFLGTTVYLNNRFPKVIEAFNESGLNGYGAFEVTDEFCIGGGQDQPGKKTIEMLRVIDDTGQTTVAHRGYFMSEKPQPLPPEAA